MEEALAESGILLVSERSKQGGKRQQVEVMLASLKRVFGIGETLASTLVGLATRIAAKITAFTHMPSWSTVVWGGHKGASRSCGPEILATLI